MGINAEVGFVLSYEEICKLFEFKYKTKEEPFIACDCGVWIVGDQFCRKCGLKYETKQIQVAYAIRFTQEHFKTTKNVKSSKMMTLRKNDDGFLSGFSISNSYPDNNLESAMILVLSNYFTVEKVGITKYFVGITLDFIFPSYPRLFEGRFIINPRYHDGSFKIETLQKFSTFLQEKGISERDPVTYVYDY